MTNEELSSKSRDIQVTLGAKTIAEYEAIPQIGIIVTLALHLRGLPVIEYEKARQVAAHFFNIHPSTFKPTMMHLAEIEFVKLDTSGATIKNIYPQVPFFEDIYDKVGDYATVKLPLNEPERLALEMMLRLSNSPVEKTQMFGLGADTKLVNRNLQIGKEAGFIIPKRARGKDILLSPVFFAENPDLLADLTAKSGSTRIQRLLGLIKKAQGWPLSLIESTKMIGEEKISDEELKLLKSLASDGVVKPPSIVTPHAGSQHFIFSPTPGVSKLDPANREIHERAMALIASVRQGQLLPKDVAIRSPYRLLYALKRDGYLRSNTDAYDQYHQLATLRVGQLIHMGGRWYQFRLIQSEENKKALDLALTILETGDVVNMELNEEARIALQKDQEYIESIVASSKLSESKPIALDEQSKIELENILLGGVSK